VKHPLFLKFGGVKFVPKAPAVAINRCVRKLPEKDRASLFAIASALRDRGMIEVSDDGDMSTSDERFQALMQKEYDLFRVRAAPETPCGRNET